MGRRVRDLMRRNFIQVSPDARAEDVLRVMSMARVRALPVMVGGHCTGLVSHQDLARAALTRVGAEPLSPISDFVHPVEPVSSDSALSDAAQRMLQGRWPCVVAVDGEGGGQQVVGLVTEGDLLREAYGSAAISR